MPIRISCTLASVTMDIMVENARTNPTTVHAMVWRDIDTRKRRSTGTSNMHTAIATAITFIRMVRRLLA